MASDEDQVLALADLLYERTQLTEGDANDLAWDVLNLVKGPLAYRYKISYQQGTLIHNEELVGTVGEYDERIAEINAHPRRKLRSVRRTPYVEEQPWEDIV